MEKEYIIKFEPVYTSNIVDNNGNIIQYGIYKDKWNIYYYEDDIEVDKQFYSYDGINLECVIKSEYKLKQ